MIIFTPQKHSIEMDLKQDGFKGQRTITLPDGVKESMKANRIASDLYISDIGFYPNAMYHYRQRENGCQENILIYCLEGSGWIEVEGKRYNLSSSEFFVIPRNTPHCYAANRNNPWSIYWMHFGGPNSCIVDSLLNRVISISVSEENRMNDRLLLFEEILQTLEMGYSMENLEYASLVAQHLLASFRYMPQFRRIKEIKAKNVVYDAILYMRDNLEKALTLDNLSNHVGYSASHFSMLFRKKTSCAPLTYFVQLKMQQASQLLIFTDLPIKEIAFRLGYASPLYFSKAFSAHFGCSPSIFRKKESEG